MEENGIKRDKLGRVVAGSGPINAEGRKPDTPADKIRKKAQKELIAEYKESLVDALRLISPVMIAKALEGDMQAVKEVNDRALGKSIQKTENKTDVTLTPDPLTRELVDKALDKYLK